jgi:BlaI family penicillinase repressor
MKRISPPKVSDSEWEIMRVLWQRGPSTASEVVECLKFEKDWHPKTAKTLLTRLVNKGAVKYSVKNRAFIYQSVFEEKDFVTAASQTFLDRVFGGALTPMLAHFVEQHGLSKKQLNELEDFLSRIRKGR